MTDANMDVSKLAEPDPEYTKVHIGVLCLLLRHEVLYLLLTANSFLQMAHHSPKSSLRLEHIGSSSITLDP